MKLLYIKRAVNGSEIVYSDSIVYKNKIPVSIINAMCEENMSTYTGRRDAVKRKFGFKRLTPIIVNEEVLLFPIQSPRYYENIWFNYHEIVSFNGGIITFRGGTKYEEDNPVISIQLKKCFEIAFS